MHDSRVGADGAISGLRHRKGSHCRVEMSSARTQRDLQRREGFHIGRFWYCLLIYLLLTFFLGERESSRSSHTFCRLSALAVHQAPRLGGVSGLSKKGKMRFRRHHDSVPLVPSVDFAEFCNLVMGDCGDARSSINGRGCVKVVPAGRVRARPRCHQMLSSDSAHPPQVLRSNMRDFERRCSLEHSSMPVDSTLFPFAWSATRIGPSIWCCGR
ncbi:hypothetical protein M011DRAFT_123895 [Sporormia fimetaria CBS 119925]|uniref:Uncharacterized protein n=1 Tax=Sporormia fimetaria CBS 119925 TaxID=1340428 RepID=A0A6A6V868_9PLEO|nr:hypothetical protein M011DRAFT_123895 [Sporormia fimetaria CBS 119925]